MGEKHTHLENFKNDVQIVFVFLFLSWIKWLYWLPFFSTSDFNINSPHCHKFSVYSQYFLFGLFFKCAALGGGEWGIGLQGAQGCQPCHLSAYTIQPILLQWYISLQSGSRLLGGCLCRPLRVPPDAAASLYHSTARP